MNGKEKYEKLQKERDELVEELESAEEEGSPEEVIDELAENLYIWELLNGAMYEKLKRRYGTI